MVNNKQHLAVLLQDKDTSNQHQIAEDFSFISPASYTLETSRPGGSALAALACIYSMGQKGFQSHLANLIQIATLMRRLVDKENNLFVINKNALGFATMLQVIPPALIKSNLINQQLSSRAKETATFIKQLNEYNEKFFNFDRKNRIINNNGVEYSFSKNYQITPSGAKISALKFYPVSPLITPNHIIKTIEILLSQKKKFDSI